MKILETIFGKKDWEMVWEDSYEWECTSVIDGHMFAKYAHYKIYYSQSRQKYRLKSSGLGAYGSPKYQKALDTLSHFKNMKHGW